LFSCVGYLEIGRDRENFSSPSIHPVEKIQKGLPVTMRFAIMFPVFQPFRSIMEDENKFFKKSIDLIFQNMLLSALTPEHPKHYDELKNLL
jgi:hypothetical protein